MPEKLRVLIVDDQVDAAEHICELMRRVHDCRTAHSGVEALAVADEFEPDVVLLDLGLPDMTGYDVARALRQRFGTRIFLAAVTGWGKEEDRRLAFAAGFDHHAIKPATRAVLFAIIKAAIVWRAVSA